MPTQSETILALDAQSLRDQAKHLAVTESVDRHWSRLALILGRVEDEHLFEDWGFASARAFAEEDLGIPPRDFVTLIELWRLMQACQPSVPFEAWHSMPKTKALLIRKVVALGAPPVEWVAQAQASAKVADFSAMIDKHLGKQTWVTFSVSMPGDLLELVEAGLSLALPVAMPDTPNLKPEMAKDREHRFKCLEIIVTEFVQRHGSAS